jgi:hypothetical protein
VPGVTPGMDPYQNGMPETRPYRYQQARAVHGRACPVCGGKVRWCAVVKDMAVCLGRCRTLVEL